MKKKYLNLLLKEIETIRTITTTNDYARGAVASSFEKLTIVHKILSEKKPDKTFADYRQWTNEPGLILIDMTDPDHQHHKEEFAKLYISIMKAFAYWKVLYAIIFKEHL